MKKLFLLLAAFTCMPTYADIDPKYVIGGAIIVLGGVYFYGRPANNAPQQSNTADETNITPTKDEPSADTPSSPTMIPTPNDGDYALHALHKHIEEQAKERNDGDYALHALHKHIEEQAKERHEEIAQHLANFVDHSNDDALDKCIEEYNQKTDQPVIDFNKSSHSESVKNPVIVEKLIKTKQKDKFRKLFMNELNLDILYGC